MSQIMDHLNIGDKLEFKGPRGEFSLDLNEKRVLGDSIPCFIYIYVTCLLAPANFAARSQEECATIGCSLSISTAIILDSCFCHHSGHENDRRSVKNL